MSGQPSTPSWASPEGLPNPLGATWVAEEEAWNFAVYSEHAERVTLLFYTEKDRATPVLTSGSTIFGTSRAPYGTAASRRPH